MARKLPSAKPLKRGDSKKTPAPTLLIVCEGETEKRALCDLRAHWRIPTAYIEVEGQAGVPKSVVNRAKVLKRERKPNETWVAFDRDDHNSWSSAIKEAQDVGIELAISNPCFEQWAIMLHEDQNKDLHRGKLQSRLAKLDTAYRHDKKPYLTTATVVDSDMLAAAAKRAKIINSSAAAGGDQYGCPSTTMPRLIARLSELQRP